MPECYEFIKAFQLKKNMKINDWKLTEINCDHKSILRWNKYEYLLKLRFEHKNSIQIDKYYLYSQIKKLLLNDELLMWTKKGRPYICYINLVKIIDQNEVQIFELRGYANRTNKSVVNEF